MSQLQFLASLPVNKILCVGHRSNLAQLLVVWFIYFFRSWVLMFLKIGLIGLNTVNVRNLYLTITKAKKK